ncbi:hypothetical protein BD749_2921 [Pontibacter ramchanderi]|uniref:Outer membrane protein with beta-barrel domain n=2 Tax=Pontibacter ramchanderi TaxID=1179743 RepID=A0A2N3U8M8_9BACT|nr:hypothetical protein BD749_2921 [Pontibacter ramchanderi]
MSDKELDRLFRKSAGQYEPPFDEEAWKAMERKLDGAQGKGTGMKRLFPILLLAMLVSVGIVWRQLEKEAPPQESVAIPAAQGEEAARSVATAPDQTKEEAHTTLPEPPSPAAPYPAVQPGSGVGISAANEPVRERTAIPERKAIPSAPAIPLRSAIPASQVAEAAEPLQTVKTALPIAAPPQVPGIARQVAAPPIPAAVPAVPEEIPEERKRVFLRSIGVTLVAAPDITTVRFKDRDAVSTNAGVLLSVPLTSRLSLVSGAVWADKLYNATPADYAPSPDYWDGKRRPDVIAAQCNVLDIPVDLQYRVLDWGRSQLTVQAGLSSYLMLNEEYTYTYYYPGREPYSSTREFSNKNRHWFGIQNLAVGYAYQLSPAITIGAAPFVKLPLASIGEGRVKLTSAGVFFSAGFTLK